MKKGQLHESFLGQKIQKQKKVNLKNSPIFAPNLRKRTTMCVE